MRRLSGIILIDDNHTTNFLNRKIIEHAHSNVDVKSFTEPEEALSGLDMTISDFLIFIDLNMPVMNGWELIEELKKKGVDQKNELVILTSSVDRNDEQRADDDQSLSGFLSKPLTFESLNQVLDQYFN